MQLQFALVIKKCTKCVLNDANEVVLWEASQESIEYFKGVCVYFRNGVKHLLKRQLSKLEHLWRQCLVLLDHRILPLQRPLQLIYL